MPRPTLLALVLLAVAALCGCTGPPPAARPAGSATIARTAAAPVPPAALDLTRAELFAALPEGRELFPWRIQVRCSRKATCTRLGDGGGRAAYLTADGTESRGASEYLLIAGVRWPDEASARSAVDRARAGNEEDYDGTFDRRPRRLGEGRFRYGLRGRGRVTPLEVSAWVGYQRDLTLRLEHLDGRTSAPFHDVFVHLARDRYTVEVEVRALTRSDGRGSAQAQVDEQLAALVGGLERLGGPERRVP